MMKCILLRLWEQAGVKGDNNVKGTQIEHVRLLS